MLETIRNAWKIEELRKKILFTLVVVLIFRIGSAIPVPFLDSSVLSGLFEQAGFLGYLNILSGGALQNATLFALSISPYITSSIVIQLLTVAIPALEEMQKEGADGRKKLNKITRYTTVGLALLQSVAYYVMNRNQNAVYYTSGFEGVFTGICIVLCFTAGSMLVVWMGEQIDKSGIGNGISMILFAGIISRGPAIVSSLFFAENSYWNLAAKGGQTQYFFLVPGVLVVFLIVIVGIVIMTNAERRIPVQYAKRVVGRKMYGGQSSYIPIKVTMSGVLPIIFAGSILSLPGMIRSFIDPDRTRFLNAEGTGFTIWGNIWNAFDYNSWFYAILYLVLIIAFNYFYVAVQYNPLEMANNLRKNSGAIPGIRPGKPTSDFISRVISKVTLAGALFIAAVAILPIIMGNVASMNIALGGTSIIIVVGVALDTVRQLESQMMMRHYKGFLE
jgi:preprotein translocase subunit SecY